MNYKKGIILLAAIFPLIAFSQKTGLSLLFEGIGDNREFSGGKAFSQTILGTRGSIEGGLSMDGHHLKVGVSHFFEFGSMNGKTNMIFYYQYEDPGKVFHFGSFPRREFTDFPLALLTDTIAYYRPNIEGMRGELRWTNGYQNIFIDWTGRQSAEVRESFSAAASGEISFQGFYAQNYFILNHLAHSRPRRPDEHVNDNLAYNLMLGWRNSKETPWHGFLQAGILGSVFRERSVTDGYIHAKSLISAGFLKYNNVAVRSILHTGQGHHIITGDPFYRLEGYMRTDLIWYFINHKNIHGKFNLSLHLTEWKELDHSQQISIVFKIP